jgi:ABC-type sugar transport system permease subunit
MLYPILFSLFISFTKWNGIGEMTFVGIGNYKRLMNDDVFIQSIKNGVIIFFMYVPVMLFASLILASLLNQKTLRGKAFFRASFFIPNITSVVAVASLFLLIFDTKYGVLNLLLGYIGIPSISWFGTPFGARIAVSTLVLWRWVGYNMIIMLSGLQNISASLYEAAKVDGANATQIFIRITMPLMRPIILFCVVMSTIGTFSLFTEPLVLTGGGPMYSTITPVLHIFNMAFNRLEMGYASSLAYAYFIIMILFTTLQFQINRRLDKEA